MVAALFGTCFTAGRLIAVPLSTHLSAKQMVMLDAAGVSAALGAMATWPTDPAVVWAGTAFFGLSVASVFPSTLNFAKQEHQASGKAITLIMQAGSAGAIVVPKLVASAGGVGELVVCLVGLVVLADSVFFLLPGFAAAEKVKTN